MDRDLSEFVGHIGAARLAGRALAPLGRIACPAGEDEGYRVQEALAGWFTGHGQGVVAGYKIGATTTVMQEHLGVSSPSYGRIMAKNVLAPGARHNLSSCLTGIECEIAMKLGSDIPQRDDPWSLDGICEFVDVIYPAIEIVENRYGDILSTDIGVLVADDFFHKACVLGAPVSNCRPGDLATASARTVIDGTTAGTGIGSDVLGNPLQSLIWLAACFERQGRTLKKGDLVMTGSITPVCWLEGSPENIAVEIGQIGSCTLTLAAGE